MLFFRFFLNRVYANVDRGICAIVATLFVDSFGRLGVFFSSKEKALCTCGAVEKIKLGEGPSRSCTGLGRNIFSKLS